MNDQETPARLRHWLSELYVLMDEDKWTRINPMLGMGLVRGCEGCQQPADRLWHHRGKEARHTCARPVCWPVACPPDGCYL